MYSETHSCSNCGGETENEPMALCDECMEDGSAEQTSAHAIHHARQTLESVKDRMDEFAYQELASALNP